jgi:hypothetical protein
VRSLQQVGKIMAGSRRRHPIPARRLAGVRAGICSISNLSRSAMSPLLPRRKPVEGCAGPHSVRI